MIKALSVPVQEDLTEFTQFLWQHEVPHRVVHAGEFNELWVAPIINPAQIEALFEMWRRGEDLSQIRISKPMSGKPSILQTATKAWLSVTLMVISAVVTFLIGFGNNYEYMLWFTFIELVQVGNQFQLTSVIHSLETFQLWRFISPIFMHFSEVHILFNCLWIWIIGTRMEIVQGRLALLVLVIFTGVISNFAQFYVSGPLFGGLSGVVYALLGYSWLWDRNNPHQRFGMPPAIMGFMVFMLALGYTGFFEAINLGAIANTAHLAGLIAGLLFYPLGKMLAKS